MIIPIIIWKLQLSTNKNIKAFTLIELLVVVAIIGILAAVGVVAYNGYTSAAKHNATMKNFDIAGKFIQTSLLRCDIESGTIQLSNTRSINCNILNSASGVQQMADVFKNYLLDQGFKNPYDSNADAIIRTGSGGDTVNGRLRLDDTPCGGGKSGKRMLLWVKTEKTLTNKYLEMSSWCN